MTIYVGSLLYSATMTSPFGDAYTALGSLADTLSGSFDVAGNFSGTATVSGIVTASDTRVSTAPVSGKQDFTISLSVPVSVGNFNPVLTGIETQAGESGIQFSSSAQANPVTATITYSGSGSNISASVAGVGAITGLSAVAISGAATLLFQAPLPPQGVNAAEAALIDTSYYLTHNLDVLASGIDPIQHFVQFGWHEGRAPDAFFDVAFYLAHNPDVATAAIDPLLHFAQFGWKEGRDPSAAFSTSKYLSANPDVKLAGIDPLQHYLQFGLAEHRSLG
jgi:hypothetical protein